MIGVSHASYNLATFRDGGGVAHADFTHLTCSVSLLTAFRSLPSP